jgi:uncharacterized protein (UPF0305 family)
VRDIDKLKLFQLISQIKLKKMEYNDQNYKKESSMTAKLSAETARLNINSSIDNIATVTQHLANRPQNKDLTLELRRNSLMALMLVKGMRDILDDLSYDEKVIDSLIENLDEGYDTLNASLEGYKSDEETFNTVEMLLTELIGLINDLQTLTIEKTHEINLSA